MQGKLCVEFYKKKKTRKNNSDAQTCEHKSQVQRTHLLLTVLIYIRHLLIIGRGWQSSIMMIIIHQCTRSDVISVRNHWQICFIRTVHSSSWKSHRILQKLFFLSKLFIVFSTHFSNNSQTPIFSTKLNNYIILHVTSDQRTLTE